LEAQARQINAGFLSRIERGRPFVRMKIAASLDGGTAMSGGESQWITDVPAREDVQKLRAACGAIMSGVGTVLADDPSLAVRDLSTVSRPPLRVIVDSRLRTPPDARLLALPGETAIFCVDDDNRERLEAAGAAIYRTSARDARVDLAAALSQLAELGINDLLVEAGAELSGSLLAAGLVDELVIYQAPHIMGSETLRMFATPGRLALRDRLPLRIVDLRSIGRDLRITARPEPRGLQ
jgi:diaminohydroxyphosphoribosylaminopyrimidine deaminase/5-amino-6-(5-phosphoribosylamino)uracil reductase